jgi:phospholipid transport system transporter-binding protein
MSGARLIDDGEGRLRLDGVLDFGTVTALRAQGEPLFQTGRRFRIDLSGVEAANSAGLALLVEWLDIARARGASLQFANMPESLTRIAAFSNLQDLLPVTTDGD